MIEECKEKCFNEICNKEMKLIVMNEKTKKKIYFHFKGTRVTIDFENGTEAEIVDVMDDYVNSYLKDKGYWFFK